MTGPLSGREFFRFQPMTWGENVAVVVSGKKIRAKILDESLDGLGLQLSESADVSKGDVVTVDNGTISRSGHVVFIGTNSAQEAGPRIGLQWQLATGYNENEDEAEAQ